MNQNIIIIIAAILPAIVLVLYTRYKDRRQPEPASQILKGFAYGVISAGIALVAELLLSLYHFVPSEVTTIGDGIWTAIMGAAVPEECAKLLMLWLLLRRNKYFDEHVDGVVYAVAVGMGFAAIENVSYLFSNISIWQSVAVSRAIFSVPGHFFFAVLMGYYFSISYFEDDSTMSKVKILLIPVLAHTLFDALLMVSSVSPGMAGVLLVIFIVFCVRIPFIANKRINQLIQRDKELSHKDEIHIIFPE